MLQRSLEAQRRAFAQVAVVVRHQQPPAAVGVLAQHVELDHVHAVAQGSVEARERVPGLDVRGSLVPDATRARAAGADQRGVDHARSTIAEIAAVSVACRAHGSLARAAAPDRPSARSGRRAPAQERAGALVCELFAGDAGDEVTAADDAARLQAAQRPQDFPPGNGQALLEVHIPEDDSPAQQQLPGDGLGEFICVRDRLGGGQQRPAALHPLAPAAAASTRARPRLGPLTAREAGARVKQRAHGVEAVGGDESSCDTVPQAFLDLRWQTVGDRLQLGVELRTMCAQRVEHIPARAGGWLGGNGEAAMGLQQPRHVRP